MDGAGETNVENDSFQLVSDAARIHDERSASTGEEDRLFNFALSTAMIDKRT